MFAFKVKDGPDGREATWVVDVKNGRGSVTNDPGMCLNGLNGKSAVEDKLLWFIDAFASKLDGFIFFISSNLVCFLIVVER